MSTAKQYAHICRYCGDTFMIKRTPASVAKSHVVISCAKYECLAASSAEHNAAVAAWNAANPPAPRQPRVARQQYAYGDYGQLVAFMRRSS